MSPSKRNALVGAVVLIALIALGWMILRFANRAANFFLAEGERVVIKSERADGVAEGAAVLFRGVQVGRVRDVQRLPDDELITINTLIDLDPPLPANLRGVIKQTSLLGGTSQILLIVDTKTPAAPGKHLKTGDVLEATYAPDISSLADDVRERQLIEHMDQAVVAIRSQVLHTGELIDSVRKLIDDPKLHDDIEVTASNVRQASEMAKEIAQNGQKISGDLNKVVAEAQGTVIDTRGHINQLAGTVNQQMDRVAATLQRLDSVATKVDKGDGSAGKFINDPRLYESLADTAAELHAATQDLRRLVRQWEEEGLPVKFGK